MNREDLYRAIGGISDKHIADVYRKICSDTVSMHHSPNERTIKVSVVRKKKRTISIIVAAALLIGSVAAAAAFMGTRKDKKEYTEKKIENYFREDDSLKFSDEFYDFNSLVAVDDGMYFTSYYFTEDIGYKVSVYDNESDKFRNIDLEGHSGKIYKMYSGENYLWIAAETENRRSELIRVEPETLKIYDCTEFSDGEWISQIEEKEGGSAVLELYSINEDRNITGWSFCTVDSSMKETDRTSISGETFPEDSLLSSCIRDEETDEYYMFFKSAEQNTSLYKYNPEGKEIYHKDDITAGMDGTAAGFFLSISGNPVIMTHFWGTSGSDEALIQFNEFDSETGDVCGMYESDLNSCFPYIGTSSWNYSDSYDFIYNFEDKAFGFNLENESSELIYEVSRQGSDIENLSLISSGNGPLMIYGTESGSGQAGYYIYKTNNEGNINSRNRLTACDILKIKKSADNHVYALVAEHESESRMDILTDRWYYGELDSSCNMINKVYLDIDNNRMPFIQDFILSGDTIAVLSVSSSSSNEIMLFDLEGNKKGIIECKNIHALALFESDGNIYAVCSNDEKSFISKVDTFKTELYETVTLNFSVGSLSTDECRFAEGKDEYSLFIRFDDGIYGYKLSDNSLTEYINWMDSDIYLSQIMDYVINSSDKISVSYYDSSDGNVSEKFRSFSRVDDDTLKKIQNRKLINAAFINQPDEELCRFFLDYNADSEEYRVHMDDFTMYNDQDNIFGISSHLDSEIIKGNIPDMIFAGNRFDWLRYSSDGMFENIENLLCNDTEFERNRYFENIFDAYKYNNIQFALPLNFNISCMTAKKSVTGDKTGYTCEELMNIENEGNLFSCGRYTQLIDSFVLSNITEYADFKTGKCDFDNQDFITLLNIIKNNGIPDDYPVDFSMPETYVPENIKMFNLSNLTGFQNTAREQQIFVGEEAVFTGYPSPAGSAPLVSSEKCVAITADSQYKGEAWNIIKQFLSDEMQRNVYDSYFPVSKSVFDSKAQAAMKNTQSGYWPASNGKNIRLKNIDLKTVDNLRNTVNNINKAVLYDSRAAKIIYEEFEQFINDIQSAEETAKNIQNKVSVYLKEIK